MLLDHLNDLISLLLSQHLTDIHPAKDVLSSTALKYESWFRLGCLGKAQDYG